MVSENHHHHNVGNERNITEWKKQITKTNECVAERLAVCADAP